MSTPSQALARQPAHCQLMSVQRMKLSVTDPSLGRRVTACLIRLMCRLRLRCRAVGTVLAAMVLAAAFVNPAGAQMAPKATAEVTTASTGKSYKWFEGTLVTQQGLNFGSGGFVPGDQVQSYVGAFLPADLSGPTVNELYYLKAGVGVIGNPYSAIAVESSIAMPSGTRPAVSADYPIICQLTLLDTGQVYNVTNDPDVHCPRSIVPSSSAPGFYDLGQRPMAKKMLYEIFFPVVSAKPLKGAAGPNGGDGFVGRSMSLPLNPVVAFSSTWMSTLSSAFRSGPAVQPVQGRYQPISGDFNGDTYSDVLWYAPGTARDSLWFGHASGTFTPAATPAINGTYVPVAGDFNSDGRDDVLWYGRGRSADSMWLGQAGGTFKPGWRVAINGTYSPLVGDFDGDSSVDDVLWYSPGTGADFLWIGASGSFALAPRLNINGSYRPVVANLDCKDGSDILWYGPGKAADSLWLARANGTFRSGPEPPSTASTGRSEATSLVTASATCLWYGRGASADGMSLGSPTGQIQPGPRVHMASTSVPVSGDFNGDGSADVLWYAPGPVAESLWLGV